MEEVGVDDKAARESVRVKRKTLQVVLEQCQRALEMLGNGEGGADADDGDGDGDGGDGDGSDGDGAEPSRRDSGAPCQDREADELCELLKSRVECPEFLEKLEFAQVSVPQNEEGSSWDMVNKNDLWDIENADLDEDDYVLVRQEDIVEGIACFMAAYLSSLKQTKELTPNQLQAALSKAWDGSKVIYNVASWGATAIGIYQNPVLLRVASNAFWTSCHVISKLL